tara:strand:+ start:46 stop:1056 length:1011 start_codon:yes stop_codon:yes gene_type:complete
MALKPPVEVPQGAIRLNTDSQKLEFYAQDQWWEMATQVAAPIGGRYLIGGGWTSPADTNVISYVNTSTKGNAIDFGDLIRAQRHAQALSSNIRGVWDGGYKTSAGGSNVIEYVTIATAGNTQDFGDSTAQYSSGSCASQTRGILAGGYASPSNLDTIEYITFTSTGNATDFGNLTAAQRDPWGTSTPTRGVFASGSPSNSNALQYITIATTGNAVDFGDLTGTMDNATYNKPAGCNGVIGLFGPGGGNINIDRVNMTTLGNAIEFASSDLYTTATQSTTGGSDKLNYFIGCGRVDTTQKSEIQTISFTTGGKATDFGDNVGATESPGSCCNAHGGL